MRRCLIAAVLVFVPLPASATVMVEVPIEDMARDADAIVLGRVEHTEVRIVVDPVRGTEPRTLTRIRVNDWIAGSGGSTVTVEELGGEVQGQGLVISGTPQYRVGEEVVVFLERADGRLRTYAMAQGRFEIRRGIGGVPDQLIRDLSGVSFATWRNGSMGVDHGHDAPVSLDSFVVYVRRIARGYGGASSPGTVPGPNGGTVAP